ncbi:MAG: short-chain fatty acyl-CoA regulator family protein [Aestuariivita sp.]|nr:short-chain fatty acyl-CoA regulator family protein [Aestuariivita sp.]
MSREFMSGSRIRERRLTLGIRQIDLAKKVGISASYLNLIEHNQRRIGGKLLLKIASALEIDSSLLTQTAEASLIGALRDIAMTMGQKNNDIDHVEQFASRFPDWVSILLSYRQRIASLERTVETLSDRLTYDQNLATLIHEVLSTATSLRSISAILVENDEIGPAWRNRFFRNLNEDSLRLSKSSKSLVDYLDGSIQNIKQHTSPKDEFELFLDSNNHYFRSLEIGEESVEHIINRNQFLTSDTGRQIAAKFLQQYQIDAQKMPFELMVRVLTSDGINPEQIAKSFDVSFEAAFRRLAAVTKEILGVSVGLVVCDASGAILIRKVIDGFTLPRFGESCPLWPIFIALNQPYSPIKRTVVQAGRGIDHFECFAIAFPQVYPSFIQEATYRASMLMVPVAKPKDITVYQVGSTCRICTRDDCEVRREPSVLTKIF